MKHIHLVNPYQSVAMERMTAPLRDSLPGLYTVTEGQKPDDNADLNYHIPWHTLDDNAPGKNVVLYTHLNPPDASRLLAVCGKADRIVCMSFAGRRELIELGAEPQKIHVIHPAADAFKYRRRKIGVIGFVQPNGRKRESLLVDLAWRYDLSPYQFIFSGGGWDNTINTMQSLGVMAQSLSVPHDDSLQGLYNMLDILIVTGYTEGGPLPLLEAMAAGVTVYSPGFGLASDLLDSAYHYTDADDLMHKIDASTAPFINHHLIARAWLWRDYAAEHALVFGRLLGTSADLFPERGMSRYAQLLDIIDAIKPQSIVEIGTWNGNRAIQMIQQAARHRPIETIRYTGYDLFDEQTGWHRQSELTKAGWPLGVVLQRVGATGADVLLRKGDTRKTLADVTYGDRACHADLYFIDGGHSVETIRSDADRILSIARPGSVIVFDDYYTGKVLAGYGCNAIVEALGADYVVNVLPANTQAEDGRLISMVMVTRRDADIHLYR